jgi:hypothetical protein
MNMGSGQGGIVARFKPFDGRCGGTGIATL